MSPIWLTLRSILLDSAVYGHIPQNSGLTRPITIVAPKGTLANPIFPAPIIARFCPGNQLADTVMKALAPGGADQVCAGIGNLRVVAFSGCEASSHWVHMEIFEGSYGGRHGMDGMDAVDTLYANTRNNPIEDIESHLPLRVKRYELREDAVRRRASGAAASARSASSRILTDGGVSVEGDGHKYPALGLRRRRGRHSRPSLQLRAGDGGDPQPLPSKVPYHKVKAGDRLSASGRAAGATATRTRAPERAPDVLDGFISVELAAQTDYAVALPAERSSIRRRPAPLRGTTS